MLKWELGELFGVFLLGLHENCIRTWACCFCPLLDVVLWLCLPRKDFSCYFGVSLGQRQGDDKYILVI